MKLRKGRRGGEPNDESEVGNLEAMEEPTTRSTTRSSKRGVKKTKIIAAKALRAEVSAPLVSILETVTASEEESKTPSSSQSAGRETKRKRTPWWSAQMSELVANPAAEASKKTPDHAVDGTRQMAPSGNSWIEEDATTANLSNSVTMSSMGEDSIHQAGSIGMKGRWKPRARHLPASLGMPVTASDRSSLAMPRTENEPASLALPALKRTRAERGSLAMPATELARNEPAAIGVLATERSRSEPASLFVPVLQSASSPRGSPMNGALLHNEPPSASGQDRSVDSDEELSFDASSIPHNSPTSPLGHCGGCRGSLPELNKQKKKPQMDPKQKKKKEKQKTRVNPEQKKKQEKHKRTLRRLRTQVSTKLKTWGLQARLLQQEDGQKAEDLNRTAQSLVVSDKQRDTIVMNMVKSCRKDPRMRAEFLGSVHRLARLGVLQTSATQLVAQVPCNAAVELVKAWKDMDALPKEKTLVPVELYKAVNKLHQEGETAMLSLSPLCKESLCSLGKTSDGAWQVVFPSLGSQKRDNAVERG